MYTKKPSLGKVRGLNPAIPVEMHKSELLKAAAANLQVTGARAVYRHRLLPDDPTLAAVPIDCREGVEIAAIGKVEILNGGVRGLFRLTPCAVSR